VDLALGHSRRQAVEDDAYWDTSSTNPSLTMQDFRVGLDQTERPLRHGFIVPQPAVESVIGSLGA
jgi:hypothetical protein